VDKGTVTVTTEISEYVQEFMGRGAPIFGGRPFTQQEWERAKRATDIINEARSSLDWDQLRMCWIAIRLSDGGATASGGRWIIYDRKQDAVKDQLHEQQCAYICFRNLISGATVREMLRVLRFHEMAYDAGMRLPDPEALSGGVDLAPTSMLVDRLAGRTRAKR
jgi:hypothetical protein